VWAKKMKKEGFTDCIVERGNMEGFTTWNA
jgi:hypothetical protein